MSRTHRGPRAGAGRKGGSESWREERGGFDGYELTDDGTSLDRAVRGAEQWAEWDSRRRAARHGRVR